jgi:hypothetical protein
MCPSVYKNSAGQHTFELTGDTEASEMVPPAYPAELGMIAAHKTEECASWNQYASAYTASGQILELN